MDIQKRRGLFSNTQGVNKKVVIENVYYSSFKLDKNN